MLPEIYSARIVYQLFPQSSFARSEQDQQRHTAALRLERITGPSTVRYPHVFDDPYSGLSNSGYLSYTQRPVVFSPALEPVTSPDISLPAVSCSGLKYDNNKSTYTAFCDDSDNESYFDVFEKKDAEEKLRKAREKKIRRHELIEAKLEQEQLKRKSTMLDAVKHRARLKKSK